MNAARQLRNVVFGLLLSAVAGLCVTTPAKASDYDTYAAIAYSKSTGHYGYGYGYSTLAGAELEALAQCDGYDATIKVWSKNSYCSLAIADDGALGWSWGDTAYIAKINAVSECRKRSNSHIDLITVYSGD